MSISYSYVCVSVATALRTGLFKDLEGLSDDVRFERRRTLSTLSVMETYITGALGLPRVLRHVDEAFTGHQKLPGNVCSGDMLVLSSALNRLTSVIASALEIHQPTGQYCQEPEFYSTPYRRVQAAEQELDAWYRPLADLIQIDNCNSEGTKSVRRNLILLL